MWILATIFFVSVAALIGFAIRQKGVPEFFPLPLLIGLLSFAYGWNYWENQTSHFRSLTYSQV